MFGPGWVDVDSFECWKAWDVGVVACVRLRYRCRCGKILNVSLYTSIHSFELDPYRVCFVVWPEPLSGSMEWLGLAGYIVEDLDNPEVISGISDQ